jgi:hypothetical protein
MTDWIGLAKRPKRYTVTSACVLLGLMTAGGGESSTNSLVTEGLHPAGSTNAVATYDGGLIAASDVAEYREDANFQADAEQNAPPNAALGEEEKLARHLAALRILVSEARRKGLVGPGWPLEAKLIEQGVLAQALSDEVRRSVVVSEEEVKEQYRTNRFKLLGFDRIEAGRIGFSTKKHGDKAFERANMARELIRGGKDFTAVAKQYSDLDAKTAETASHPGNFWGKSGAIALAELGEGKVSEPLPVQDGFELVKVERIPLHGDPSPEEAKANLRLMLNGMGAQERIDQMAKAAETTFPMVIVSAASSAATNQAAESAQSRQTGSQGSSNVVVLRCGQFSITKGDVWGLAAQRRLADLDGQKVLEIIQQESGDQVPMGEMARSMGFAQRPEVQRGIQHELDKRLAAKARQALLPELAAELTFSEERIREAYDKTFTATFAPQMHYDALVVPLRVPANATTEVREAARTNALAKAEEIIRRVQDGAKLEEVASGDTTVQWLPGQSRLVNEGSALAPVVAGLKPEQVATQPYEDFGGYCVIRVAKSEPRRKMPYELAKNYIIQDFRNEAMSELQRDFETVLLHKYHFAFGRTSAGRTSSGMSAAPGEASSKI